MKKTVFLVLVCTLFFCAGIASGQSMSDYCSLPPFVSTTVKPNVMIVMDFSGSMQFPAYIPCNYSVYDPYNDNLVDCRTATTADGGTYDPNKIYYGYFETDKCYYYSSSYYIFQENTSCSSCNTDRIGNYNCISGNLLNWITMTRVDVGRKVFTGGRPKGNDTSNNALESHGAMVTYTDTNLHCRFMIDATYTNDPTRRRLTVTDSGGTCPLGNNNIYRANIDVRPWSGFTSANDRRGVIHDYFDRIDFEFLVYRSGTYYGRIKAGKSSSIDTLVNAINGEVPYGGTPTGTALYEAYDFFKQSNEHSYDSNSSYISPGNGRVDPWYDYDSSTNTSKSVWCRKSFILLLTDGAWNTGGIDPIDPARAFKNADLRSLNGLQNVNLYTIFAFGDRDGNFRTQGKSALMTAAMFGGYPYDSDHQWPYPFTGFSYSYGDCGSSYDDSKRSNITDVSGNTFCNSRAVVFPLSQCNPSGTWNEEECSKTINKATGFPYNYYEADDPESLLLALNTSLNDMLSRVSSGTAASVLASSEGSGANLLQAVFYPRRIFDNAEIVWTGEMQNLWYYIDPYLANSSIREDRSTKKELNLASDNAIEFYFEEVENKTKARKYSSDAMGTVSSTSSGVVDFEEIQNIWQAGLPLWSRTTARTIYTRNVNNLSSTTLLDFAKANASLLKDYLVGTSGTVEDAENVIDYVHGIDKPAVSSLSRRRAAKINTETNVWKLGDIINSTPRIQSSLALNTYHLPPPDGYLDPYYLNYINSSGYLSRGMAYVGANDGMLHAFKLGSLDQYWTGMNYSGGDRARLTGTDLGKEEWAFIPTHILPYLKYLGDPNYCHIYYVDLPVSVFDASVSGAADEGKSSTSWRTILIGGMGIGGACKNTTNSCVTPNCVKTPYNNVGFSSYFALDVTDENNPTLLWEFAGSKDSSGNLLGDLGFSTSGAAIVRAGPKTSNGDWFAVFASGPTGPIDTYNHQFLGQSDQKLKLFVVNLRTGDLVRVIDTFGGSELTNAFGGSMFQATIDTDRGSPGSYTAYTDDALYFGYTRKNTSAGTWTNGGVIRVLTKEDPNPSNWVAGEVINGIGPVTTSVAKLQDRRNGKLWLFFGTGRYFYRYGDTIDDMNSQRTLYGLKEMCYNPATNDIDNACVPTLLGRGSLANRTSDLSSVIPTDGWYIDLDTAGSDFGAERVITDPLAAFNGVVFFTTFSPSSDICALGGNTYLWAVDYQTGNSPYGTSLIGKALIQISTGEISQINLPGDFSQKGGRRTAAIRGVPPKGQGLSLIMRPKPLKKILHQLER